MLLLSLTYNFANWLFVETYMLIRRKVNAMFKMILTTIGFISLISFMIVGSVDGFELRNKSFWINVLFIIISISLIIGYLYLVLYLALKLDSLCLFPILTINVLGCIVISKLT